MMGRTVRSSLAAGVLLLSVGARAESYRDDEPGNLDPVEPVSGPTDPSEPQSGDLKPPSGDMEDFADPTGVEKDLERSDLADSGRGLEYFWLSGDVGAGFFDLAPGARGQVLPGLEESGAALAYGGGLGARLLYFSVGGRFRALSLRDYDAWTLALELGLRFPLGALEPYTRLGIGYLGLLRAQTFERSLSLDGISTRLSGGADYYFSDSFSLGAELGLHVAYVSRGALADVPISAPAALGERVEGAAVGAELLLNVGFHL